MGLPELHPNRGLSLKKTTQGGLTPASRSVQVASFASVFLSSDSLCFHEPPFRIQDFLTWLRLHAPPQRDIHSTTLTQFWVPNLFGTQSQQTGLFSQFPSTRKRYSYLPGFSERAVFHIPFLSFFIALALVTLPRKSDQ